MSSLKPPLTFLSPAWFSVVMGLAGLALAWQRAVPLMGDAAAGAAQAIALLATGVLLALLGATALRLSRHPQAWQDDLNHPVRHTFVSAIPIAVLLVTTAGVGLLGPQVWLDGLWRFSSLALLGVTWWVLVRWWRGHAVGGLQWSVATPALIIPVVGNVLVPLAGVPLGHADWAAMQFGVGLLFWPVVLTLLMVRLAIQGPWPERLLPATFILIAPPAVIGLAALQLGAPRLVGWMLFGMALMTFFWVGALAPRILKLPFSVTHWGMSFPLTALASLALRLAEPGGWLAVVGPALLALASLLIFWLALATVRGLRDGSLLAPEPIAALTPQ